MRFRPPIAVSIVACLLLLAAVSPATGTELATQLRDLAGGFKVGSRLFTAEGPTLVRRLVARVLRAADMDDRCARWGITTTLGRAGIRRTPSAG